MKTKMSHPVGRLPLALCGALLIVLAAIVSVSLTGLIPDASALLLGASGMGGEADRLVMAGLAGGFATAGLIFVGAGLLRPARVIALPGAGGANRRGKVRVTRESMLTLVEHAASELRGVRVTASKVRLRRRKLAWDVTALATVTRDVPLRDATPRIQAAIDEVLLFHTGIPLGALELRAHVDEHVERELVRVH